MKLKYLFFIYLFTFILGSGFFVSTRADKKIEQSKNFPTLEKLNISIEKAQKYYEGLYTETGRDGAIVKEYYSNPKSVYTVRHATIGGIYYYEYIGDATKSAKLRNFVKKYGYTPEYDEHSFMWTYDNKAPKNIVYSIKTYHDCNSNLPIINNNYPYHSKVCKLGTIGIKTYIAMTKHDTFVPMTNSLQILQQEKQISLPEILEYEKKYDNLGFGMPVCTFLGCSSIASTIRTAHFGEIELRLGRMKRADNVANNLLKAQNDKGAIYVSYDKDGNLKESKSIFYTLLNFFLNDKPIYNGFIPTNAETMNDALAFLLHYRCTKYSVGCK